MAAGLIRLACIQLQIQPRLTNPILHYTCVTCSSWHVLVAVDKAKASYTTTGYKRQVSQEKMNVADMNGLMFTDRYTFAQPVDSLVS